MRAICDYAKGKVKVAIEPHGGLNDPDWLLAVIKTQSPECRPAAGPTTGRDRYDGVKTLARAGHLRQGIEL